MTRAALLAIAAIAPTAAANVIYDEAVNGDLSGDRFNPTIITLGLGQNTITMDVVDSNLDGGDRDYFTFSLAGGLSVDAILLADASNPNGGFDATAFVGLGSGNFFDFDPDTFQGPGLIGFVLTTPDLVGTDIIGDLNATQGALTATDYSVWVQQTGQDVTRVSLTFNVVPAPTTAAFLGLAALATTRRRR